MNRIQKQPRYRGIMFDRLLQFIAVVLLISGIMSLFSDRGWLFDLTSHFPVQAILAIPPLLLLAALRKLRITVFLLSATLLFNFSVLASSEWLADRQHLVKPTNTAGAPYRLMTLNVLVGNTEYKKISELINEQRPDSVLILELTPPLAEYLQTHLTDYPHFFGQPIMRAAGIGVFSRRPMQKTELLALGNQYTPAVYMEQSLESPVGNSQHTIRLVGIHPWAPIAPELYQLRNTQLRELTKAVTTIEQPLVVAGDFNITPWSNDFRSLLKVGRLKDTRVGFGLHGTWPSCLPLLSIPIDHVLTSDDIGVKDRRVVQIAGSDHCGVIAELVVN